MRSTEILGKDFDQYEKKKKKKKDKAIYLANLGKDFDQYEKKKKKDKAIYLANQNRKGEKEGLFVFLS